MAVVHQHNQESILRQTKETDYDSSWWCSHRLLQRNGWSDRNAISEHYQLLSFGLRQESQTDEDFLFRLKVDFKRTACHEGEAKFCKVSLLYEVNIIQSIKMPLSIVQPDPYGTCVYCSDDIDSASKAD